MNDRALPCPYRNKSSKFVGKHTLNAALNRPLLDTYTVIGETIVLFVFVCLRFVLTKRLVVPGSEEISAVDLLSTGLRRLCLTRHRQGAQN